MYYVIIKCSVNGFHNWKEAPEKCAFLRDKHRHTFEITAKIKVGHNNRDIEIIEMQQQIENALHENYGKPCNFGSMSCEMIAKWISERFYAFNVEVLEDGYNGGAFQTGE